MARWRDIKQGGTEPSKIVEDETPNISASIPSRIKAFVVDMFMIMMPLAYITTYVFLDGKDEFQGSNDARWAISLAYGLVIVLFWAIKGQTPGYKAYDLTLIDEASKHKVTFPKAIFRYLSFLFSAVTIVPAFLPFFRQDKKTFQDIITKTIVISNK